MTSNSQKQSTPAKNHAQEPVKTTAAAKTGSGSSDFLSSDEEPPKVNQAPPSSKKTQTSKMVPEDSKSNLGSNSAKLRNQQSQKSTTSAARPAEPSPSHQDLNSSSTGRGSFSRQQGSFQQKFNANKHIDNHVAVSDPIPSILSAPFLRTGGSVLVYEYSVKMKGQCSYVVWASASWDVVTTPDAALKFKITGYDKERIDVVFREMGPRLIPRETFEQRYLKFYKQLLLEFYTISDDRAASTFQAPAFLDLEHIHNHKDKEALLPPFFSQVKAVMFFPSQAMSHSGNVSRSRSASSSMMGTEGGNISCTAPVAPRLQINEQIIDDCLLYWSDRSVGFPYEITDPEQAILQARYGKMPRYTINKVFPSIQNCKAIELYDYLMSLFKEASPESKAAAREVLLNKMAPFKEEELHQISIKHLLYSLNDLGQTLNDFYSVSQIEKYNGFDRAEDDSLIHLYPILGARSFLSTSAASPPSAPISLKSTHIPNPKPTIRHIVHCGRFLRKHPLTVLFWNKLTLLPLAMMEVERRLLNTDISHRLAGPTYTPGPGILQCSTDEEANHVPEEKLLWQSLQTKMVDMSENYETMETLGDSILKFVVSAIIFSRAPLRENKMTGLRMKLISNLNLAIKAMNQKLYKFVYHNHKRLARWTPGLMLPQDTSRPATNQLPMSMLADIVEGLIGATFVGNGRRLDKVLDTLIALDIWPEKEAIISLQNTEQMPQMLRIFRATPEQDLEETYYQPKKAGRKLLLDSTYANLFEKTEFVFPRPEINRKNVGFSIEGRRAGLESTLGYTFKNKALVDKFLKRRTNMFEFERLEFLGDAAIELRAVELCYRIMPRYYKLFEPHDLHKAKIYLLSNHNLAFFTSFFYLDYFVETEYDQGVETMDPEAKRDYHLIGLCSEIREYSQTSLFGQFLRHELGTIKVLGDIWESLMAVLLADGGWEAFDAVYTRATLPFVYYICKFCKYLEGSVKSAAFEIMEKRGLRMEQTQLPNKNWRVTLYSMADGKRNVIYEVSSETLSSAEEMCYFFISYSLDSVNVLNTSG